MFTRLVLSSVLACGLLTAPLIAEAGAASRSILKGRTSQGYKITLKMQGQSAFRLHEFKADLNCRDGSLLLLEEGGFLTTRLRDNGSFKDVQYGRTDTVWFRGKVTDQAVRGQVRLEDKLGKKKIRCTSRWIDFNVKR